MPKAEEYELRFRTNGTRLLEKLEAKISETLLRNPSVSRRFTKLLEKGDRMNAVST